MLSEGDNVNFGKIIGVCVWCQSNACRAKGRIKVSGSILKAELGRQTEPINEVRSTLNPKDQILVGNVVVLLVVHWSLGHEQI